MGFDLHLAFSLQPHVSWTGLGTFITIATGAVSLGRWLWKRR